MTAPTLIHAGSAPTWSKGDLRRCSPPKARSQAAPDAPFSSRRAWSERSEVRIGANRHPGWEELLDSERFRRRGSHPPRSHAIFTAYEIRPILCGGQFEG